MKPPSRERALAARQRWDEICDETARTLWDLRPVAQQRGEQWLVDELEHLAWTALETKRLVDGRRCRPDKYGAGFRDVPEQLDRPPYEEGGNAVTRLILYHGDGLGLPEWDWERGWPRTWPSSLADRAKAYLPYLQPKEPPQPRRPPGE